MAIVYELKQKSVIDKKSFTFVAIFKQILDV
jgi:hypothetical protein